jgi:hypothetical protein
MVGGLRQPTKGLFMNVNDTDAVPTYLGRGDPAGRFADYYPAWFEKLADDATLEGSIEDYTAEVHGKPLGCLHLITFNADGQAQHIAAHYRPLSSLMFFSRLLRETLAGTPYAEGFLDGEA